MTNEYFADKVCIVTGAASGIGYAVADALLQRGARVTMADRDSESLASCLAELEGIHPHRVRTATVDVTVENQVMELIEQVDATEGRLDALFNNAGIGGTLPIGEATSEHWRRIIDVNLWSVIYGVTAALPIMRRQGSGHIVNTSSFAGLVPMPYQSLYGATKFAVSGMSEALRYELADEGIHVSVVCPGNVATRIFGTPIIGKRVEVEPPADAIPAPEAAQIILAGVENREGIIVFPESARTAWRSYWADPTATEPLLTDLARQRRESYRTTGGDS
ncbi:MAG: SDR family oxidoreductase [Rhodococcus sp. (in: high G+C Gram-positive bacteria)]|uniref:SDR family NAD(P)-dependent oxidoreductase n=1 Tax=Rhodococcus sp. TaxID=1831 RepID=UPI003BB1BE07